MNCKYKEQGACKCERECDELDTQMMASIVVLILILVGFTIWSFL